MQNFEVDLFSVTDSVYFMCHKPLCVSWPACVCCIAQMCVSCHTSFCMSRNIWQRIWRSGWIWWSRTKSTVSLRGERYRHGNQQICQPDGQGQHGKWFCYRGPCFFQVWCFCGHGYCARYVLCQVSCQCKYLQEFRGVSFLQFHEFWQKWNSDVIL